MIREGAEQECAQPPEASPDERLAGQRISEPKKQHDVEHVKRRKELKKERMKGLKERNAELKQERAKQRNDEHKKLIDNPAEVHKECSDMHAARDERKRLENDLAELHRQLENAEAQKRLEVKKNETLKDELEKVREQLASVEMRKKLADDESKPGIDGELLECEPELELGSGLMPKRDLATGNVGADAPNPFVSNGYKKPNLSDVQATSMENLSTTSDQLSRTEPLSMADRTEKSPMASTAAGCAPEHVAACLNSLADLTIDNDHANNDANNDANSDSRSATCRGDSVSGDTTNEDPLEPGDLMFLSKSRVGDAVFNGSQFHAGNAGDSGDAGATEPAGAAGDLSLPPKLEAGDDVADGSRSGAGDDDAAWTAKLPKKLYRIQSMLSRLGRNENEKFIDTVLDDYQVLHQKQEQFRDVFDPKIEANNRTHQILLCSRYLSEIGPLLSRVLQAYAFLTVWGLVGFDLDLKNQAIRSLLNAGVEDLSTASTKLQSASPALRVPCNFSKPAGGRGRWDFSPDGISNPLDPEHPLHEILHYAWDAAASTEAWLKTIRPIYMDPRWKEDPKEQSHYPKLKEAQGRSRLMCAFQELILDLVVISRDATSYFEGGRPGNG